VNPQHLEAVTPTANQQGVRFGADAATARHSWIKRGRAPRQVKFAAGELPYNVRDMGYETSCWIWRRPPSRGGYGRTYVSAHEAADGIARSRYAHVDFYERVAGPIPDGLVLDHLCGQTGCVNPRHLEPVTQKVNIRRKLERHRRWERERFVASPPQAVPPGPIG
jgi:hypothetical protein